MYILKCSSCSQQVNIAPEFAGSTVKCPVCGTQMNVPGAANADAVPPPMPASASRDTSSFAAANAGQSGSPANEVKSSSPSMNYSPEWCAVKNAGASAAGAWSSTMSPPIPSGMPAASRLVYIVLAIFLGVFGVHNFVIGLTGRGAAQLALGGIGIVFLPCTAGLSFILVLAAFIWSIIDIVTITADSKGVQLN